MAGKIVRTKTAQKNMLWQKTITTHYEIVMKYSTTPMDFNSKSGEDNTYHELKF
jgi:hypothetical protein